MRKIFLPGLIALTLSIFSGQLLAEKNDECDDVKGEKKGLYGLCIAYWNTTNAVARQKILENFEKNAGENGPGMPGLDEVVPCTCWTEDHVLDAMDNPHNTPMNYDCDSDGANFQVANFNGNTLSFFAYPEFCVFVHPGDFVPPTQYGSEDAELTCRATLLEIIWEVWGDDCGIPRE